MAATTLNAFRELFAKTLSDAGFETKFWQIGTDMEPVVIAENSYYLIAFQVFDIWRDLVDAASPVEMALSELITKAEASEKTWDAYLVLTCRGRPIGYDELNEWSNLSYDTRYTRKIVRAGLGDSLEKVIEVARPFIYLERARYSAKHRNPLDILEEKLVQMDWNRDEVKKLITVFKERGNLENV